jgi:hypothetical protein
MHSVRHVLQGRISAMRRGEPWIQDVRSAREAAWDGVRVCRMSGRERKIKRKNTAGRGIDLGMWNPFHGCGFRTGCMAKCIRREVAYADQLHTVMKTPRVLVASIASLVFWSASAVHAQTWDGGGVAGGNTRLDHGDQLGWRRGAGE